MDKIMISDRFEHSAAKYVSLISQSVPGELTSLVFSSPLSARSPDVCLLWHGGYRERHMAALTAKSLLSLFYGLPGGCLRLAANLTSFGYALFGKIKDAILVVSLSCGHVTSSGRFETQYLLTGEDDAIFVFGTLDSLKKGAQAIEGLTFKKKASITWHLVKGGISAFLKLKGDMADKNLLLSEWLSWSLNLKWLNNYYFGKSLSDVVERYSVKKIGCIHEMHSYSRIVWGIASRYGLKSYTLQHATITEGKRWYFCYPEEKAGGLALPDVIYVYNDKAMQLLRPYYEKTKFIMGCSYRYSHWKDAAPAKNHKGKYYLFAGALAGFDNELLIGLIRKLSNMAGEAIPIRVRLHPLAKLKGGDNDWLKREIRNKNIHISEGTPLKKDIEEAIAVIGMSTTVLEEALLMARPVIQITHPDYLQYIDLDGIEGVMKKDYKEILPSDLAKISNRSVDHEQMKNKLGLGQPLVTYERLFS